MTAVFGKAPDSAEFVREGEFGEPEGELEAALQDLVERGGEVVPSRFLVAGPEHVRAGAWIPSQDAIGRAFPLALSLPLPAQTLLSIAPVHYMELLDVAVEALHLRRQGTRALPYLIPPHPSMLLPRVHRARGALAREPARRFQLRALGTLADDGLTYALATIARAAVLDEPVALSLPSAAEDTLFAWLELLGALAPTHALALIWSGFTQRAWIGWAMDLGTLCARMPRAWPLRVEPSSALDEARASVGSAVCDAIARDAPMGVVLAELGRELARVG